MKSDEPTLLTGNPRSESLSSSHRSSTEQSVILSSLDTVCGTRSPEVLAFDTDQRTEVTLFPDLTNFELRSPCLIDKGHRPW